MLCRAFTAEWLQKCDGLSAHNEDCICHCVVAVCTPLLLHRELTLLSFTVTGALVLVVFNNFFFFFCKWQRNHFLKIRLFEDAGNMVYLSAPLDHQDWMIKLLHKRRAATSPSVGGKGQVSTLIFQLLRVQLPKLSWCNAALMPKAPQRHL